MFLFFLIAGLQISGSSGFQQVADSADRLYNFLESGNRLDPPIHCPLIIKNLMNRCWNFDPKERPLFDAITPGTIHKLRHHIFESFYQPPPRVPSTFFIKGNFW